MKEENVVTIKLEFEVEEKAFLLDITSLLYDFELLHDFLILLSFKEYSEYKFTQYFWYRYGRPLEYEHKLRVVKIVKLSPLTVIISIGALVASRILLPLIEVFEKIADRRLNRQKLRLEVQKLQSEVRKTEIDEERSLIELDKAILEREGIKIRNSILKRLEKNPIKLIDMSVTTGR